MPLETNLLAHSVLYKSIPKLILFLENLYPISSPVISSLSTSGSESSAVPEKILSKYG